MSKIDGGLTYQLLMNRREVFENTATEHAVFVEDFSKGKMECEHHGGLLFPYSGGLESSMGALGIHARASNVRFVKFENIKGNGHIELALIRYAAENGFSSVVLGAEYTPTLDKGLDENFRLSRYDEVAVELGINVINPVAYIDKFNLFRRSYQIKVKFSSCDAAPRMDWCGCCFDCFQIASFAKAAELTDFFWCDPDPEFVRRIHSEVEEHKRTNLDPHNDDCHSFVSMERETGKNLLEVWGLE